MFTARRAFAGSAKSELVRIEVDARAFLRGEAVQRTLSTSRTEERPCLGIFEDPKYGVRKSGWIERRHDETRAFILDDLAYGTDVRRNDGQLHHHRFFDRRRSTFRARDGCQDEDVHRRKRRSDIGESAGEDDLPSDCQAQLSAEPEELLLVGTMRFV